MLENVYGDSPAIASIDHEGDFVITNKINSFDRKYFQVEISSDPEKCADGSLKVELKMMFKNFNGTVRLNNKPINLTKNEFTSVWIEIPKNELKNKIFYKIINLKTDSLDFELEPISIRIQPKVEISVDQKKISFGRVYSDGQKLVSTESPFVIIKYSVLKDAVCEVYSENNFQLKNKNHSIFYTVNGISKNTDITFPAYKTEYVAKFRIREDSEKPATGTYSDRIIFSIKTDC